MKPECVPLGEAAWIVRGLGVPGYVAAERLSTRARAEGWELVPSYDAVAVFFDPARAPSSDDLLQWAASGDVTLAEPRRIVIPVCYTLGDDLAAIAKDLGVAPEDVVRAHAGSVYTCFALGFRPGFPYLGWLPPLLDGRPRRDQPRQMPTGAVAIAGRQTGIYPQPGPGGWWEIGRTPLTLVDLEEDFFPIRAGDEIRFVPIDESEYNDRKGERL